MSVVFLVQNCLSHLQEIKKRNKVLYHRNFINKKTSIILNKELTKIINIYGYTIIDFKSIKRVKKYYEVFLNKLIIKYTDDYFLDDSWRCYIQNSKSILKFFQRQ